MIRISTTRLAKQAAEVRDLLANKNTWARYGLAANRHNEYVEVTSPDACKFCLVGAIAHVVSDRSNVDANDAYLIVRDSALGPLIADAIASKTLSENLHFSVPSFEDEFDETLLYRFNDRSTHEQVMDVLHTAVAVAEGARSAGVKV